jgi:hypothetical protein
MLSEQSASAGDPARDHFSQISDKWIFDRRQGFGCTNTQDPAIGQLLKPLIWSQELHDQKLSHHVSGA